MEEKLRGIVLSGVSIGESDKILNVFTLEKGIVSAKIKGVKKAGAKLKFASEPFCFAEFLFSKTQDRRIVVGASLIDSFYPVREDIVKFYSAGVVLEFLKKFAREEMTSEDIFFKTVDALKEMAYGDKSPKSVLIEYLLFALKSAGYQIDVGKCHTCKKDVSGRVFFDYTVGGFLCENCHGDTGREVNFATFSALKKIVSGEELSGEEQDFCLRLLDYYIVNKTEEKINSLKELLKIIG